MSKLFIFYLLMRLTGSPIGALVILVVFWWGIDRAAIGLLPDPVRVWRRWRRTSELRRALAVNPHDRRARLELASLLVERRGHTEAIEILKPNVAAGDHDAETLYVLGVACFGAGRAEQGEVFLGEAREADANFRLGAVDLELGRWRLANGDARGAREALEKFCEKRTGTVEGRVLLARAIDATGDASGAKAMNERAWDEYVTLPGFKRREERLWAWRARPSRPIAYAAAVIAVLAIVSAVAGPSIRASVEQDPGAAAYDD